MQAATILADLGLEVAEYLCALWIRVVVGAARLFGTRLLRRKMAANKTPRAHDIHKRAAHRLGSPSAAKKVGISSLSTCQTGWLAGWLAKSIAVRRLPLSVPTAGQVLKAISPTQRIAR